MTSDFGHVPAVARHLALFLDEDVYGRHKRFLDSLKKTTVQR